MKKTILGFSVLLLAAGCNNVGTNQSTQIESANKIALQKYAITAGIKYVDNHPQETHFSVLKSDGSLLKTLNVPSDLMVGRGNNVKVFGNKIYYMSGTEQLTSIGEIDIQTGNANILGFTKTQNTNIGNVLYGIIDWAVSDDNSKIAWLNTDGKITVADTNGTNIKNYDTGIQHPTINEMSLVENNIYFKTDQGIKRVNLNNGAITILNNSDLSDNATYAISQNSKYLAYSSSASNHLPQLTIKNLNTDSACAVASPGEPVNDIAFSPDGTKLAFTPLVTPGVVQTELVVVDPSNCNLISSTKNYGLLDFLSDSTILMQNQIDSYKMYSTNLQGQNVTKFSSESFEGTGYLNDSK